MYRVHRPDITIMDIDMPLKSGLEAAREIRALDSAARIIFCSGGIGRYEQAMEEIALYGDRVVRKPFLPAQLYQALAT
jgi:two-component system chemotaxis response regulator CheY